ncbi:hypothetical protein L596_010670 [Steinernema carpocapsae]|uniref:Uncharacterized protein n=1 Tax=Steinernema carpocapsae TaxID=34508 RepID=A0A4U5PIZ6_STECR|nr:hypothetical protein L596_010670 [Steinernema carpocapsae]
MSSRQRSSTCSLASFWRGDPLDAIRVVFLVALSAVLTRADIASGNEVVGEPFISCSADAIYAKWKTNSTFTGHVNVRYTPNRFCYQVLVTNNQIELSHTTNAASTGYVLSTLPA